MIANGGSGPPRLTNFLRAYGSVTECNHENYDPVKILALRKEQSHQRIRESGVTWKKIKCRLEILGEEKKTNVSHYLRELWDVAQTIAPELDTREEIAVMLFHIFHSSRVLSSYDKKKLSHFVGEVKQHQIDRAHKAVRHIVNIIGDDEIITLLTDIKGHEELHSKSFGINIKIGPFNVKSCDDGDENTLIDLTGFCKETQKERSLNFEDYISPVEGAVALPEEEPSKNETYDKSWIEAEMLKFCNGELMFPDLVTGTETLLLSSRSDDELQNELFDLLGFDHFELIQSLLRSRKKLKEAETKKEKKMAKFIENVESISNPPSYGQQVTVMSESEKQYLKQARKDEKKLMKAANRAVSNDENSLDEFNPEILKLKRELELLTASQSKLFQRTLRSDAPTVKFPFVFDSYTQARQSAAYIAGLKMTLPVGFERVSDNTSEEVKIPRSAPPPVDVGNELLSISELDEIGQNVFSHCKTLNKIQTVVYPVAYHSNDNLLICAPTGAGKTNIALLTVVHQIKQHVEMDVIHKEKFKIVYIAPMKALAAEMALNFGKRLQPLGLTVKELTGDMHLTKPEIMATNMIITTPEKWDVTTRKPGDTQLSQLVKLLIIDEVHLLHGDRGPVLETIVARTLRMVESQQSMIRIVGLSATLPNYIDVATFLHVNPYKGLFFFDSRFRPVPLDLSFIGIKALSRLRQMEDMDKATFDKALNFVQNGHQVMIFVHARNGTLRTAENLIKIAQDTGKLREFRSENLPDLERARKELSRSRNKKLLELFDNGFCVHHAGLLRTDRNIIENLFRKGMFQVLVTTATLAWGVNLPAHAVIIKGTEIYDSRHGQVVDLGILDVLQIFGRAGRPQYDKTGTGIIVTSHDKLSHYLSLLTNQYPIESSFINLLADNLNAEIALGNVTNVEEAIEWLSYTYLYVRMRKNPQVYGILYKEAQLDPTLEIFRREMIKKAASALDKAHMVRFDESTGYFHITDLGRVASQYYIKYDSVEVFNEFLKQIMNEADILSVISQSSEYNQLKVREEEMNELEHLHSQCEVVAMGGIENVHGKVNVLLQTFLSRNRVDGFSLVSDMNYVTENSVRIARALFEIVLHKGWPLLAGRLLTIAKMLERQMWHFESPLSQFNILSTEIVEKINNKRLTVEKIRDMDAKEIGIFIRHEKMGKVVRQVAWYLPLLNLDTFIQPITRTVLRVKITVQADFTWNDRVHGSHELYWVWIEDPETNHMYHQEQFTLTKKQVIKQEEQQLVFTIPIFEPLPPQYYVRAISDRWIGCESTCTINFQHLILPKRHPPHTELLDLEPLPVSALDNELWEKLYKFQHFNPIQTQIFHCLYHTDCNVLLGAPTGSGKTVAAEIAMFRLFRKSHGSKAVYIAPLKALVRERVDDWKIRLQEGAGIQVIELTGDVTPDIRAIRDAQVIVTTPEKWDGISRSWQTRNYVKQVDLIIIDEIHLLGEDRGPVLEVIVSRTNFISNHTNKKFRIIGLSTALANARDLADWLGIKEMGLYNFRPSVRPVPLEVHISGFSCKHYCPRMAVMNKPTYQAIRQYSPEKPALVFVSSRRQTRLTGLDLIAFVVTESNPKQWLQMPEHEMDQILTTIHDENLRLCLSFGIGLHHAGLTERDRKTVEQLFVNMKIQILITTATLAWGVNFPAHLVVIKGTEYFDGKTKRYVDFPITDVLQMMGRAGRPQFDDNGVAVVLVHDQKKHFYKKFIYEPFPVESSLLEVLPDHLNAEIVAGTICNKQEALDYLTWTYFFRRILQNPSYYGLDVDEKDITENISNYLTLIVNKAVVTLGNSYCLLIDEDGRGLEPTHIGKIASFYYLSHKTVQSFYEKLNANVVMETLLDLLSKAYEYDQLPVRHNEDVLNAELAKMCPISVDPYTYDSPYTKAHLLLQAHLSRLHLPCVDYLTDTKSVLDQALRILQAMLDICASAGWLAASLQVQILMQMITQGRWHTDSSILVLPHVTPSMLHCFVLHKKQPINSLPELLYAVRRKYGTLASMLRNELTENQIEDVFRVIEMFPAIRVDVSIRSENGGKSDEQQFDITKSAQKYSEKDMIKVDVDEDCLLTVNLRRLNKNSDLKVHAPKFPKAREEGWFLVLGDVTEGELLVLKRVPPVRGSSSQILSFKAPSKPGETILTLYLMSDSIMGLDQQYDIPLRVQRRSLNSEKHVTNGDEIAGAMLSYLPASGASDAVTERSSFQNFDAGEGVRGCGGPNTSSEPCSEDWRAGESQW